MNTIDFVSELNKQGIDFFSGVPDSKLKPLCNYLMNEYGLSDQHIIAANEGNAVAIAAGYHLATSKIPCVYLQNSGLGNTINPVLSLLSEQVYGIPCLFIIGWRGEPGLHDEPQHLLQGEVTLELLKIMNIKSVILDKNSELANVKKSLTDFKAYFNQGKSVAFVVKKDAFSYDEKITYKNTYDKSREDIIQHVAKAAGEDVIFSTTGKSSRELYEIRESMKMSHQYDFLTVGSMGHSSSIALGAAISRPNKRVWCIDGDGAAIMHMGSMAVIGSRGPKNFIHVLINNEAHESVGGQPTAGVTADFKQIALGCGYKESHSITDFDELDRTLSLVKNAEGPIFIEIKSAIGSRSNLGRPTSSPIENKNVFMNYLNELNK